MSSKAEELATKTVEMAIEGPLIHLLSWADIQGILQDTAAELRRLAALEKAIMGAEPVAWIYWNPSDVTFDGPDTIYKKAVSRFTDDTRLTMQRNGWKFEPLYTLNGIK